MPQVVAAVVGEVAVIVHLLRRTVLYYDSDLLRRIYTFGAAELASAESLMRDVLEAVLPAVGLEGLSETFSSRVCHVPQLDAKRLSGNGRRLYAVFHCAIALLDVDPVGFADHLRCMRPELVLPEHPNRKQQAIASACTVQVAATPEDAKDATSGADASLVADAPDGSAEAAAVAAAACAAAGAYEVLRPAAGEDGTWCSGLACCSGPTRLFCDEHICYSDNFDTLVRFMFAGLLSSQLPDPQVDSSVSLLQRAALEALSSAPLVHLARPPPRDDYDAAVVPQAKRARLADEEEDVGKGGSGCEEGAGGAPAAIGEAAGSQDAGAAPDEEALRATPAGSAAVGEAGGSQDAGAAAGEEALRATPAGFSSVGRKPRHGTLASGALAFPRPEADEDDGGDGGDIGFKDAAPAAGVASGRIVGSPASGNVEAAPPSSSSVGKKRTLVALSCSAEATVAEHEPDAEAGAGAKALEAGEGGGAGGSNDVRTGRRRSKRRRVGDGGSVVGVSSSGGVPKASVAPSTGR